MSTLPFNKTASLLNPDGSTMKTIPIAAWPATGTNTSVGRAFDHEGQAPQSEYNNLISGNRRLSIDGIRYMVVSATLHEYLPHVALRLREMRPGGQG